MIVIDDKYAIETDSFGNYSLFRRKTVKTGKKAGEFYTPQAVSQILTRVAIQGQEDKQGLLVYDAAMGSGSLLLNAKKFSHKPDYIRYFGQELSTTTYNLARMNMFLHDVDPENQELRNADTLDADQCH
jgi:type I restriction enzyme M protein